MLRTRFEEDVDILDKCTNFCSRATNYINFHFFNSHFLKIQDGGHLGFPRWPPCKNVYSTNILSSKPLKLSILVSKDTFSGVQNAIIPICMACYALP